MMLRGGKTAERAHANFIYYKTTADWLDFECSFKGIPDWLFFFYANQPWVDGTRANL